MKYSYKFMSSNFMSSNFMLILLVVIIIIFNSYTKPITEGFETKWSPDLIRRFNIFQATVNDNVNQFDLELLQKQATPEEAEQLLKTGYWPWPEYLKDNYLEGVWSSPIIKINPEFALNYAMRLYNQTAARDLLAWNTKEGQFLLYGGDLGISEAIKNETNIGDEMGNMDIHNSIKCVTDKNGNSIMQKKIYTGMNTWNGYMNSDISTVKPEDIPKEMRGFSFVKDACNPCVVFNSPQDYSCPFKLNVEGDDSISDVWKSLWNL